MREKIHPKYYQAKVSCTCGNEFVVGSTKEELKLDICSACHPFFTGKQKFVDTAGRVDKYFQKYGEEAQKQYRKKKKKRKRLSDEEMAALELENQAVDAEGETEATDTEMPAADAVETQETPETVSEPDTTPAQETDQEAPADAPAPEQKVAEKPVEEDSESVEVEASEEKQDS